ncbi:hypothetical protein EMIHUDRAFT_369456, partial [Emiliania huxleyi CCMP1516]|uniref:Uncharacterized protein n=2 Tax=Emiliania huxleyi TaxID=2903 RepID=A0A0D3J7B8_EMIH1
HRALPRSSVGGGGALRLGRDAAGSRRRTHLQRRRHGHCRRHSGSGGGEDAGRVCRGCRGERGSLDARLLPLDALLQASARAGHTSEHGAEGRRCAVDGLPLLPPRRRQSQRRAAGRAVRDLQRGQGGGRRCGDDGRRGWSRGPHVLFDGAAGTVPLPLRVFGCEALRRRSFWSWQGPLYPLALRLLLTLLVGKSICKSLNEF